MSEKVGLVAKKAESKGKESTSAITKSNPSQTVDINSPVEQILHLQRTIGNQAVTRLIRSGVLQAKLTIGQPGDIHEQEADRVADRVMRMTEPQGALVNSHLSLVQRQSGCPGCEEEEKPISRKEAGSRGGADVMSCVESHINALKGGGQSLSPSTRGFFEPRFGSDFSHVRVHTGSDAAAIATEINAKAFTTGRDIFFNTGQYSPGTTTGKNLLAHELTHVVQQSGTNETRTLNSSNSRSKSKEVTINNLIKAKIIQGSWRLSTDTSSGTNCFSYALGLSSTWFPPNPSAPYNEKPALAAKMASEGFSRASDGAFASGRTKVMLIYDLGWRAPNSGEIGPTLPGGGFASIACIWKHAIVQRSNESGKWRSQNGIGGRIYVDIDTPTQFVNNFYPPVAVGSQPGGVSLPQTLLSRIVDWTNEFEYWVK